MKIGVLPDVQAKPGLDFSYLTRQGRYFADKKPDVIVCLGDFADMESLSSYDKGKKSFEGRRYKRDIAAAKQAMEAFMAPLRDEPDYTPRLVMLGGNHEQRIVRATEDNPELDEMLSLSDLEYEAHGWECYPFLEVVVIEGIAFSHYFVSGVMGRPITSASALLAKRHMSAVAGHQQGLQMATSVRADGAMLTGIICGSAYEHEEKYLGPQGNTHFRGILLLNDARRGEFEVMPVTNRYLKRRYG